MIDCPFCHKPTDALWACPNCFQDFMNDPVHSRVVCSMDKPKSNSLDEEKVRHYIITTLRKQKLAAI